MTQDERKVIELALEASKDLCTEFALAKVQEILTNALAQPEQEPFEYWNAVEGWVKIDEVREHLDSVGCGTIYKIAGEGRVPLSLAKAQPEQEPVAKFHVEHRTNACSEVCDAQRKVYATCAWHKDAGQRAELICSLLNTPPPQHKEPEQEILVAVFQAITNAGLTLLKTQHGYELRKLGPAIAHNIKE